MTHTFPLFQSYHACPACGYILESREDFQYSMGIWKKELTCPRCAHHFNLFAPKTPPLGPLFGPSPKPEFDWRE